MRRFLKLPAAVASFVYGLSMPTSAAADVNAEMNQFWNDLGVAANVTGPSSFEGQRAGYYTFGNVYVRTPQRSLSPVNIQMPGYRAGCGGIDIYGGGFSYVNSAELVAFMKSVANNAASFAFQVALETISPVIAEKVGELQSVAQRINQMAINSCESGQLAVAAVWPQSDQASRVICEASASRRGLYPDWVAARHGCGSEGERSNVLAGASVEEKASIPQNINIAWDALKKHPVISGDRELMQFLMTLSGTEILTAGADDDAAQSYQFLPSKMLDPGVISAFLDGGTIDIYECETDPDDLCLAPTTGGSVTIASSDGLRARVSQMLADIMGKVRTRTALTADEQAFLNVTSLPVYKMINVHAAYEGVFADQTIQSYAEIIAIDLLYGLFEGYAEMLSEAGSTATSGARDSVVAWKEQLTRQREFLLQYQLENNARVEVIEQVIARTQAIERQLAGRLSKDLADAYQFSRNASY
ncbi:TraH [Parvularcula bermudensis HTCC2503]|uniref:TraH n=1 Tax=Parvularcula bermudensis (strain ATCC BAA-594 / HTCC2503 / KCTC 12087) TaxID=314260 RepID=E0TB00_PARBH|nr:conjugal transfer protein TraH [Parvularcula bermudensis]ADM08209.1 TraH [Parvularcula bermudensis HTCC2503]